MALRTDEPVSIQTAGAKENPWTMLNLIGYPMTQRAAEAVFKQAGVSPQAVDVAEVHDCFSAAAATWLVACGFTTLQNLPELIESKALWQTTPKVRGVPKMNVSGGLISKGHPLGATGIAQCAELAWQLRGECGPRQVAGAKVALQHNLGLGGAVVMAVYRRPDEWRAVAPKRARSGALGLSRPSEKYVYVPKPKKGEGKEKPAKAKL